MSESPRQGYEKEGIPELQGGNNHGRRDSEPGPLPFKLYVPTQTDEVSNVS